MHHPPSSGSVAQIQTARFKADTHPRKLNLGVGAYRSEELKPVVFSAVRKAEAAVLAAGFDKEYLPITGMPAFNVRCGHLRHLPAWHLAEQREPQSALSLAPAVQSAPRQLRKSPEGSQSRESAFSECRARTKAAPGGRSKPRLSSFAAAGALIRTMQAVASKLMFGSDCAAVASGRMATCQTLSGTGSLTLAAHLLK